ncbi:calcium-binding protein [Amylibacter sp. IMCC11727]|uniref:calcium-binding protein n=1 Tax=Amylibacter sp. IMCC11727 TaxID=3039851 RepID=UPI00244DE99D|nr:calcium-binding protein [Amylibacter sp. IMCC11727]WGI21412.1 calcium-binding protein [Amylibacter sp. IMCC11727]
MLEIIILSVLGFAGTAIGGLVASEDEPSENTESEADAVSQDTGGDLLDILDDDSADQDLMAEDDGTPEESWGDDRLTGGDGDDTLSGGAGDDVLTDWSGNNHMFGGDGDDTLRGGFEDDAISHLHGGAGDDLITDGESDATIFGGDGEDVIVSGHGTGDVFGGAGDDDIATGIDTDVVHGDSGDDTITAIGTDTEGEVDEVYGGEGNDELHIRGATEAYGGEGEDTFTSYFNTWVEEAPTVMDFDAAEDRLEVDIYSHEGRQELDDFDVDVQDFEDGSGASIFVDGVEVMRIPGAQGLDLADVQLNLV